MTPWTYSDYRKSVESDVAQGIEQLGFSIDASIGFAANELLLRLDEFPAENVFALTALAITAHQHKALSTYKEDDDLYEELACAYSNGDHIAIAETLDSSKRREFYSDVATVAKALDIDVKPLP